MAAPTREESQQGLWTGLFVLVLALVVAGVLIFAGGSGHHPAQPTTVLPTATMDAEGAWNPYAQVSGDGGAASRAAAQWTPVAQAFAAGFLGASHDPAWLGRLRPVISPQLLARLRYVHRREVPTGTPGVIKVEASGTYSVDVTVPYGPQKALGIGLVDLPKDGRGWMVYSYEDRSS